MARVLVPYGLMLCKIPKWQKLLCHLSQEMALKVNGKGQSLKWMQLCVLCPVIIPSMEEELNDLRAET